jgi:hypothetical protein
MRARESRRKWQIAECLLPVSPSRPPKNLRRITAELEGWPRPGVCFLGCPLMPGDEVLMCVFRGPQAGVRSVSERAGLPFERILVCVGIGWPAGAAGGHDRGHPPTRRRRPARVRGHVMFRRL